MKKKKEKKKKRFVRARDAAVAVTRENLVNFDDDVKIVVEIIIIIIIILIINIYSYIYNFFLLKIGFADGAVVLSPDRKLVALKRAGYHVRGRARGSSSDLSLLLGLLGQENRLDVGENTTLGDRDAGQELVELLVVADGELQVTGDDPGLLVVAGGVTGQLEDLGGEVLHHGGQVDRSPGTDALGVVALAQESVDTTDGELQTGPAGTGLCLSLDLAAFAASGHDRIGRRIRNEVETHTRERARDTDSTETGLVMLNFSWGASVL
jgi:hypothetical protein